MLDVFGAYVRERDFDAFKANMSTQLAQLGEEIKHKATDSENEAKQAASNATASLTQVKQVESEISHALAILKNFNDEARSKVNQMEEQRNVLTETNKLLLSEIDHVKKLYDEVATAKENVLAASTQVDQNIEKFNSALATAQRLPDDVKAAEELLGSSKTVSDSIQDLLSHSMTKKAGIDDLYKQIHGYEVTDGTGNAEHIDGLKDKLEKSYVEVAARTERLAGEVTGKVDEITIAHEEQLSAQRKTFNELLSNSSKRVDSVSDQLTGLLPGAMAEGLSAAYEKKKDDEVVSLKAFEFQFKIAIGLMATVSLIPLGVDTYLLTKMDVGIIKVIQDTPKLILAILPLYFPVLWLAYSLNKKVNLSKRLIEEYTHKAVLGKTFSGLSNQIDSLPSDSDMKDELRTRLLFNLLHVSSENPGKLISDYNKADHPLMDVLEKSAKLSDAMETLGKFPGLSVISKTISSRAEKTLEQEAKRVADGVVVNEVLGEVAKS